MAKRPISATIEEDLIEWMREKLEDKEKYRNMSHLIEVALLNLRRKEKK
jgi:Arc/MetJ-type ribon-helix-helix transcriptional regulator